MRKWIALGSLFSMLWAGNALATDQRANALMYNLGIEDDSDIFLFPHLASEHQGFYFDAPASYTDAFGGAVFQAGNTTLGIFLNRPAVRTFDRYRMDVTANPTRLVDRGQDMGGSPAGQSFGKSDGHPIQVIADFGDFAFSTRIRMWPSAGGGAAAAGTSLAGTDAGTDTGTDTGTTDLSDEDLAALFGGLTQTSGNAGPGSATGIDLGLSFDLEGNSALSTGVGFVAYTDVGSETNLDVNYRRFGAFGQNDVMAAALQIGIYTPEKGDGDKFIAIPLKYGWIFNEDQGRLKAAVLTGADLQFSQAGAGDMNMGVGIPVVEAAAEYSVTNWMFVRSGIKGGFGLKLAGNKGYSDLDKNTAFEQTEFNTGVGFVFDRFVVDASVGYSTLTTGPHFIGGPAGGPFFSGVSLAYKFDGAKGVATAEPAPMVPAAAPVSAPVTPALPTQAL